MHKSKLSKSVLTQQLMLSINEASMATDCRPGDESFASVDTSLSACTNKNHTQL